MIERYGLIWVWMGDPALADPGSLPKITKHGEPGWDVLEGGYQYHPSNYRNIIENLMDPAHTTFVHSNTIGNPLAGDEPLIAEKTDQYIVAYRWIEKTQPTPYDRKRLNVGDIQVDRGQFFYFYLPCMSRVETIVVPAGTERVEEKGGKGLRTFSYKFLTPEQPLRDPLLLAPHPQLYVGRSRGCPAPSRDLCSSRHLRRIWRSKRRCNVRRKRPAFAKCMALEIDRAPMLALRMLDRMIDAEAARGAPARMRLIDASRRVSTPGELSIRPRAETR